jgi:hypothetical protein
MKVPEVTKSLESYDKVLTAAVELASSSERPLYDLHVRALEQLKALLPRSDKEQILTLMKSEERQFGWSYLSGDHGDEVEKAFYHLLRTLEEHA